MYKNQDDSCGTSLPAVIKPAQCAQKHDVRTAGDGPDPNEQHLQVAASCVQSLLKVRKLARSKYQDRSKIVDLRSLLAQRKMLGPTTEQKPAQIKSSWDCLSGEKALQPGLADDVTLSLAKPRHQLCSVGIFLLFSFLAHGVAWQCLSSDGLFFFDAFLHPFVHSLY